MIRFRLTFLGLLAAFWMMPCPEAQGQNFRRHSTFNSGGLWYSDTVYPRHGVPIYGFGYVYDPYERGSFTAPDLLNDPLFQARHKFDSRFPGRYQSSGPALQFKNPALNVPPQRTHRGFFGRRR